MSKIFKITSLVASSEEDPDIDWRSPENSHQQYFSVGGSSASVTSISAIKTDGTLWAKGLNNAGQLGLGDTINRSVFTQVGSDTDWKFISLAWRHTLAIKTDGTLWAWGKNSNGELGLGDTVNRSSPVQVGSETDWLKVQCSNKFTFAIREVSPGTVNGSLWAWGRNNHGQLGLGDITPRSSPTQIGSKTNWRWLSTGNFHSVVVSAGGDVWSTGKNGSGQLGIGNTQDKLLLTNTGIKNGSIVRCGSSHTLLMRDSTEVWACGLNIKGQLGVNDFTNKTSFTRCKISDGSPFSSKSLGTIAAGGDNSAAIELSSGKMHIAGSGSFGITSQVFQIHNNDKTTWTDVEINVLDTINQIFGLDN